MDISNDYYESAIIFVTSILGVKLYFGCYAAFLKAEKFDFTPPNVKQGKTENYLSST